MSSHLPVLGMHLHHLSKPVSFYPHGALLIQIILTHLAHVTASPGCLWLCPLHSVLHRAVSVGSRSVSSYKHFGDCIISRIHTQVLLHAARHFLHYLLSHDITQALQLQNVDNLQSPDCVCSFGSMPLFTLFPPLEKFLSTPSSA